MRERQPGRVQPLPGQAEPGGERRVRAIGEVADAGVADRRHVNPNLVGAPGLEADVEQAGSAEGLDRLVVRDAVTPARDDGELVVGAGMAADRGVDRPTRRVGMPLHQRPVALVDLALPERVFQPGVRDLAFRDDHQPGRANVEPVHDALPLCRPAGRDAVPGRGQPAGDGGTFPSGARVGRDPDRLVDHDQVGVLVNDPQARDPFGEPGGRAWGRAVGKRDVEQRAGGDPGRLARRGPVEARVPGFDEARRRRPGEPEDPRDGSVQPHAVQPLRDGQRALRSHIASVRGLSWASRGPRAAGAPDPRAGRRSRPAACARSPTAPRGRRG